jgi:hypothetical protein
MIKGKVSTYLPWEVSDSIRLYLEPTIFPPPIGGLALGEAGNEDTTWIIHHDIDKEYRITQVERGGIITSIDKHESHPLEGEGIYNHPLKYKVHMDAKCLSPNTENIRNWLRGLCNREPHEPTVHNELVVGDVIFTGDNTLIRRASKSAWSHASIYIGNNIVGEALMSFSGEKNTISRPLDKGSGIYRSLSKPVLEKNHVAVLRHPYWKLLSEEQIGSYSVLGWSHKKYSISSALRSWLYKHIPIKIKHKGVFCSQYVLDTYYQLGLEVLKTKIQDSYTITPDDLFHLLQEIGFERIILRLDPNKMRHLKKSKSVETISNAQF